MKLNNYLLAAALGMSMPSDLNSHSPTENMTLQDKLEDIRKSVSCIRQEVEYVKGNATYPVIMHGTVFVYKIIDGEEYLITNNHVVSETPDTFSPEAGVVLTKQKDLVKLVLSSEDKNTEDDVILERMKGRMSGFNEERKRDVVYDTFMLKVGNPKENLYQSNAYKVDFKFKPRINDSVYVFACRESMGIFLLRGFVSNESYNSNDESDALALDMSTEHGSSGGPVFIEREGQLYLAGHIRKFLESPLLGIATKVGDLVPYWENIIKNDQIKK
ncbi:MAG: trypsin-like peptidase domain-containing protein [archaeon]|nr:trypsin-like peptidase domain-containing protein [archaeon]